jgi:hypothetical protein
MDFLAPQNTIFSQFNINQKLSKSELAHATHQALIKAKLNYEGLFLIIGKLLKDVRDKKLYEELDYDNFTQFLNSEELSFSRESAYLYIRTFEYFIEGLELNPQVVQKIGINRLSNMIPLLKTIENDDEKMEKIEELSSLRHSDFMREVKRERNKQRNHKPEVFWVESLSKWNVQYWDNHTNLHSLGDSE